MKKLPAFVAILWLALTSVVVAEEAQVFSSLDKNSVEVDEEIALTIRIVGARGNLEAPRLPSFEGFDTFYTGRTSHFTFMDGKSSSTVEFTYVLIPKVAGRFTLRPIEVWIEGKRHGTQPLEVEVRGPQIQPVAPGAGTYPAVQPRAYSAPVAQAPSISSPTVPPPGPTSPTPAPAQDDNIFVKAWVDKQTVFTNEQILLTYTFYTRYDTRLEGFEEEPTVSGFWIEEFPVDRDLGKDTVIENGKRYVKADIRKLALFPTAPARYTIDPGSIKVSIREEPKTTSIFDEFFGDSFFSGASFFARRVDRLLKPPPLQVTVRPFPEAGKPTSFNGAVGRFRMNASLDKNEVKQNEPVTLTLVIEGEGNIETLPLPSVPELTSFKVYDGNTSSQFFRSGVNLGGRKTFEIIFIPTEAGNLAISPLEFSFFDPQTQRYEVLRTPDFPLKVIRSEEPLRLPAGLEEQEAYKKEVSVERQDIRYIHSEFPSGRAGRMAQILSWGLGGANFLGFALVGNGLFQRRRDALFARDTGLRRRRFARPIALRRLKKLKGLARSEKEEAVRFMEGAEKVLSEYLSNKFNVSSYRFTREWLEEKLSGLWGPEDPLLKRIQAFYNLAGEARFGRGILPAQERRQFLQLIEAVIRRLERLPEDRLV